MAKPARNLYIGCISGTSVDGLDVAAVRVAPDQAPSIIAGQTYDLPTELRKALLALETPGDDGVDRVGRCDVELGRFIAASVEAFIAAHALDQNAIAAIGSHGQTIRHRPPGAGTVSFTAQIGDPNQIAERTGITTVADFRRRDMAANGQGAPLVPPFHRALFSSVGPEPVILNIGGISNISILTEPLRGFDTGPGNALLDAWCARHTGRPYDESGRWAQSGESNEALLATLMADAYFGRPPPKSTGREHFTLAWLEHLLGDTPPADVQATLVELTAKSVADAVERWAPGASHVVVCGGGRLNAYLMARLGARLACPVSTAEHWNVDGDAIEAAAFAWLAYRTLAGLPGNAAEVTGADGPRVLGAIYPA